MNHRPGLLVGTLAAVLLAVAGVAAYALVRLGSPMLAAVLGVAGAAACLAAGAAYAMAREVAAQLPARPEAEPAESARPGPAVPVPPGRTGFRVREARPGEVPAPYLAAVQKGAQATHAALKARARPDS